MNFADSITIIVARPLVGAMIHGGMFPFKARVACPFVGVYICLSARESLNVFP